MILMINTGISMLVGHVGIGLIPILPLQFSSFFTLHLSYSFILYSSLVLTTLTVIGLGYIKVFALSALFPSLLSSFL